MELDEVVADAASHHIAAGVHDDLDGVFSVLHCDRAGDVVEFDGLERHVQVGAAYIDRRLLMAL